MPTDVSERVSWFDRFAGAASELVSQAWFFAACVLLVVVWAPSLPLFGTVDTWQLVINTATTIITFLLVALLQNAQQRSDQATQHKLNALAAGLAALMTAYAEDPATSNHTEDEVRAAVTELLHAVGLERRESTG
jgi:low affinity Fe/Cu permease